MKVNRLRHAALLGLTLMTGLVSRDVTLAEQGTTGRVPAGTMAQQPSAAPHGLNTADTY